jgi:hypothetical protein
MSDREIERHSAKVMMGTCNAHSSINRFIERLVSDPGNHLETRSAVVRYCVYNTMQEYNTD